MSIRQKFLFGSVTPLSVGVFLLVSLIVLLVRHQTEERAAGARDQWEQAIASRLRAQVHQAAATIDHAFAEGMSAEETLDRVKGMTFGSSYVWIHTCDPEDPERPVVVMHPVKPSLDGTEVSDRRDLTRIQGRVPDSSHHGYSS